MLDLPSVKHIQYLNAILNAGQWSIKFLFTTAGPYRGGGGAVAPGAASQGRQNRGLKLFVLKNSVNLFQQK